HLSVVCLDHVLHKRQPDTAPPHTGVGFATDEALKDAAAIFQGDPGTAVGDNDIHVLASCPANRDPHPTAGGGVLERVVDQVDERDLHRPLVQRQGGQAVFEVYFDRNALVLSAHTADLDGA